MYHQIRRHVNMVSYSNDGTWKLHSIRKCNSRDT